MHRPVIPDVLRHRLHPVITVTEPLHGSRCRNVPQCPIGFAYGIHDRPDSLRRILREKRQDKELLYPLGHNLPDLGVKRRIPIAHGIFDAHGKV